jgi:hypothetical protein
MDIQGAQGGLVWIFGVGVGVPDRRRMCLEGEDSRRELGVEGRPDNHNALMYSLASSAAMRV